MRRCPAAFAVAVTVLALAGPPLGAEEGAGAQDLAKGREALARREYAQAVEHLHRGVLSLDPTLDAATIADAWLQIGIAYLNGLDHPEEALPAFIASAGSAADPATAWLWASVTAEKLGRTEEALIYRARALSPQVTAPTMEAPAPEPAPAPEAPAPAPEPAEAEAPREKPDAVQHFFGPEAAEEPAAEAKPAEPAQAEEKKEKKEKVDAFEHFFGEKDKPKEEGEGESEEKPPGA
jgi:tetratricopeptide (TPR) repeat protein